MKNTHKWAKRLLMIFASSAAFFSAERVMAQTTCGSSTPLTVNGCNNNIATSDTVFWFSFNSGTTATWSSIRISRDTSSTGMTGIQLYSGSCGSLSLVQTGYYDMSALILETNVSPSTNYYVKVKRTQTSSISFDACLRITTVVPCAPCTTGNCQLVCNPSMELYSLTTLTGLNQLYNNVCNWTKPLNGTPDYFNTNAAPSTHIDVPLNFQGTENPHSGNGYAGAYMYYNNPGGSVTTDTNFREYIQTQLVQPLTANLTYRVSFWVSLSDFSGYALGHIGAYLSTTQPIQNSAQDVLNFTPQISHSTAVTTINGWTLITNTFTPTQSGIQWVTIGSFETDAQQQTLRQTVTPIGNDLTAGGNPNWGAYYYIDDVKVDPEYPITLTYSPNPLCYGIGSFNITVTTPLSNGNYTWTNPAGVNWACTNASCSTITVTPPYNYNATYSVSTIIPSYGNCTATGTITPTWNNSPTAVSAGSDQTICLGGSATLLGTGTGVYDVTTWSIPNISTICSGCTTTVVSPTVTTNYVYTLTNSYTGCSLRDTVKITVVPLAVTIVSPPGASVCGGWFNFTTANAYSTYSWSVNTVNNSGGNTSTLSALWGTPYDTLGVTGTVYVSVVDANGCQGSASLTVPSCCPFKVGQSTSYPNLLNDSTSRVYNVTYPSLFSYNTANSYYEARNKQFSINGIYVVDRNTRLQGCEVKLGPNAKIIIRPGIKFELTDSTGSSTFTKLYACSDMWDGIYVDGTNTATKLTILNRTVIEDAKNAVVSTNGGNFFIDGGTQRVKFNKNNIGVLIKPFAGVHPGVIRRAMFSCDAPNQPGGTTGVTLAGPNCRAPISGIGFAGVYVETCNAVIIGDSTNATFRNIFERMQYGVYSKGSNVKVWNNDFKYFTNTIISKSVAPNGIAVYATAGKFNAKYLTVGRQGNYKAKNKFTKCSYGVFAQNYMNLNCEFNRFDSCMTAGISTLNCLSTTILINKDTLTECTGTNVSCVQVNGSTVTITSNLINNTQSNNATNFGQTGIYVANAVLVNVALKIQYNTIKKMRNGIWVTRVKGAKITDNNPITFIPSTTYTVGSPARGIVMQETNNSLVRANTVTYNGTLSSTDYSKIYGVYVQDCHGDTVSKNSLTNVGSGIFLKNNDKPSVIACNTMTTCKVGINFGYVNSAYTPIALDSQLVWGTTNSPTGNTWIGMSTVPCIQGRISGGPIAWYYNANANATPTNNAMWANSFTNSNTPSSLGSTADKCSQMLSPPQLTPAQVRDRMLGNIVKAPSTYDTLNSQFRYAEKVYAYRSLRENPSWKSLGTSNDSYYSGFYTTESATNIGIFANVEDSLNSGKVAGATSILSTITPAGTYEVNRKTLLGIYIATWAVDSMKLSATQEASLLSIANQHPLMGGNAVYDARVMLNYEVNDSSSMRMIDEPFLSTSEDPSVGHVYPNPTTGNFTIAADIPEGKNGTMELFDISGRKVATWKLAGGQKLHTFDASSLPEGMYIYQVRLGEAVLASDRLIIIHE